MESLERIILEMESELHIFEQTLDKSTKQAKVYVSIIDFLKENQVLSTKLIEDEKAAISFKRKCDTLKGAVKFKPSILEANDFSFLYDGSSPKSCVVLSFHGSSTNSVSCDAKVDSSTFQNHGTMEANRLATVSSFVQVRVASLCGKVCRQTLHGLSEIPPYLRQLDWELGRLEGTAKEIAVLKERYRNQVSLNRVTDSSHFHLKIHFTSLSGQSQLGASFEVREEYPFSPIIVCLDTFSEKINVEALQQLLVKNAKPGFGYLSRLCDIVAASLH
jgi:hypothetical protein